ncbi:MAG: SET domain-containing protein [Gemmatimonadota bacterium]
MTQRLFRVHASPIHGRGAFATGHIPAGTRLIEYAGERLTPAEAEARYPEVAGPQHTMLFAIDDDVVVDCDAIIVDKRIWIETIRDANPAEELTYDYQLRLETRHTPAAKRLYPCRCGSQTCRGTMLARK